MIIKLTIWCNFGIWPNCNNNCKFCLRKNRDVWDKKRILHEIGRVRKNIDYIDWKDKFADGISILGGEIYFITDSDIQDAYMQLIDDIVDKILLVSNSPRCRYSTVTNGMYDPAFLFRVIDRIKERTGSMKFVDVNFSYDIKYRYPSEEKRLQALENIKLFRDRYNYTVGVQMILTQYLIDDIMSGKFDFKQFINEELKDCNFCFLYPHPINSGFTLTDFFFKREDFLNFCIYLKAEFPDIYNNMYSSTNASAIYKYTGLRNKSGDIDQQPILSDGKEKLLKCGHSKLYQCYSDSKECMLCDLLILGE